MARQLDYKFEELPLLVTGGIDAGLVNGSALLNYWPDGQWGISEIYLEGYAKAPSGGWLPRVVMVDRGTPLHSMIFDRLDDEWRPRVQDAVNNAIEEELAHA
jgi:hypothetical protein